MIAYIYVINKLDIIHFWDPIRTLEFAIFPSSITAVYGLSWIGEKTKIKHSVPLLMVLLAFLGTLIYPSVFVYKNNFENTPFYDIRSDIRHIPKEGFELMEWAYDHGYSVRTNSYVITEYQNIFYPKKDKKLLLLTKFDRKISKNYGYVKNKSLGIPNPQGLIEKSKGLKPVYSNRWGSLYQTGND